MDFKVGDKFSSISQLELAIANYSKKNYVDLHKRDAKTLQSAVKSKSISEDRVRNKELKYYIVKYVCIFGGRDNFKARGEGSRKTKTFQCGCPFFILLRLSEDGQYLEVTKMNESHDKHEIDENEYRYLPKVRKLTREDRQHVSELMAIGANKKKIQQQMSNTTGKRVTLKDLSNIENRYKSSHHRTKNDISSCVEQLKDKHNCTVDVCIDTNDNFCGLFVQDKQMSDTFSAYPEILFLDATYKLLELCFPVYIFVVEDANGEAEIVGMGALVHEDAESLGWLIESFKKRNPNVNKTRLVMADKDLNERDMLKELLPSAKILICLFHALKTFRREITMDAMKITSQMKDICLHFIQKMCYAKSPVEYNGIYSQFSNVAPASVRAYFDSNWHPIREEWVAGFKQVSGNFMNSTNNRLESINAKLKQVIKKHSTLEFFIENFFIILPVIRNQRTYNTVYQVQKRLVKPYEANSPEALYMTLLTSYAFSFVLNQLQLFSTTTYSFTRDVTQQGVYLAHTSDGNIKVSSLKCTCCFFQSMILPCRHIFHVRTNLGISLYDKSLCANRWTNAYSRAQLKLVTPNENENGSADLSVSLQTNVKKWSAQQKYSRAMEVCKKIANVVALSSQTNFEHRLSQLSSLHEAWGNGDEIGVQVLEQHSTSTGNHPDVELDNNHIDTPNHLEEQLDSIHCHNDTTMTPMEQIIGNLLPQPASLQLPSKVDNIGIDFNKENSTTNSIASQITIHETETDSLCAFGTSIAGSSIIPSHQPMPPCFIDTKSSSKAREYNTIPSHESIPPCFIDTKSSSKAREYNTIPSHESIPPCFIDTKSSSKAREYDIIPSHQSLPPCFVDTTRPSTSRDRSNFASSLMDSFAEQIAAYSPPPPGYFMSSLLESPSQSTARFSFTTNDYDDDLSNFNLNFIWHNPNKEVIKLLSDLVGEVVIEEEVQRLNTSPNIFDNDKKDDQVTISTLKKVKMPPPVKVVGRPKGSGQTTVIGTKKISKNKTSCPKKFNEMRDADKEKFLLSLCIGRAATDSFFKQGKSRKIEDIDPTEIGSAVFHPAVCLEQIRYFFTIDAWEKLKYYVHSKSVHLEFSCRSCNKSDENSNDLISCEHCLKYFHISCARLKKNVKKRQPWFCAVCKAQERLETEKSTEESN